MWSGLSKLFRKLLGGGRATEPSFSLPEVDRIADDFVQTEELEGPGGPITAREGFELAAEILKGFDSQARLTNVESVGRISTDGRCEGWQFQFYLPARWGQAFFVFKMGAPKETLTVELRPFVAVGSALAKMMDEGQTGFVEQQWKVEMERNPELSPSFVDSSEFLAAWQKSQAGAGKPLPPTAIVKASTPPLGKPRWDLFEVPNSKKSLYSLPIE